MYEPALPDYFTSVCMQRERLKSEHATKLAREKELQLKEKMKKEVR